MKLQDNDHIYKIEPPLWFNDDKKVVVELKCAPKPNFDAQVELETTYGMEAKRKSGREFVSKYVKKIVGLEVGGKKVETFEQLYESGPADLYNWIYAAVLSQKMLTEAEVKNS